MFRTGILRSAPLCAGVLSVFFALSAPAVFPARASGPVQVTKLAPPASFAVCAACHATEKNAAVRIGPNLFGVGGRAAGTQPNFNYSPAMKASQIRWNRANLLAFVRQPSKLVPGTRMPFAGIQDKAKGEEIVNYLLSLR